MAEGGNLNKKFIGIFVFFGLFATLLATMPIEYSADVTTSVQDKEAVDFFSSQNVTIYNNTVTINMTVAVYQQFDWGLPPPEEIEFIWDTKDRFLLTLQVRHNRKKFLGYWYGWHRLKVQEPYRSQMKYPSVPKWMEEEDIVTAFWDAEANASFVELAGNIVTMKLFIKSTLINETLQEAWDNGRITLYSTYNIDWKKTGTSAWGILMQLLTFQTPVLGIPGVAGTILSTLVSLTLWGSIALIAFAFITALIPYISGWGGD